MTLARAVLDAGISEREFRAQVLQMARTLRWEPYVTWTSVHSPAGFPDLVMVRDDRMVIAELKTVKGKLTERQTHWLTLLQNVAARSNGRISVHVWRPDMFDELTEVLR